MTDLVIKFLRDHPKRRNEVARLLVVDAFREAFPCNGR